jgi:indole-3-glycerol phosphate synthase
MGTVLDRIVAAHREAAAADIRDADELREQAEAAPAPRKFRKSMGRWGLDVIAEIKRRSPSKGDLAPDLDPAKLALAYADGGAVALSVLTDREFFGGSPEDLAAARDATNLPALRKDFTVDERDIYDARIMGADAVLLIVAALSDDELKRFHTLAHDLALGALVEIHDAEELKRGLRVNPDMIGVNQRDLRTFEVDRLRAIRLARVIPAGILKVAESGIETADDLVRLRDAGYDGVLVGEHLVTSPDPAEAVRRLREGTL